MAASVLLFWKREDKEFNIPCKTVLNEYKDKIIIPEYVQLAVFKEKKEETWDDIIDLYLTIYQDTFDLDKWLKENYNPPTKK